jgi:tRNA threonylcarbamoyladenosine biosynthesis protein TsaB
MLLLAIDTAGPVCAAAIAREGCADGGTQILARRAETIGRGHAERLMPMIDAVLCEAKAKFSDLGRIAVTTGPGSFTGIRVGIAAARGLALALGIPAVGVGSLTALAEEAGQSARGGTVVAALDAKHGQVYALARDIASGLDIYPATILKIDDLVTRLAHVTPPIILRGGGAPLAAAALTIPDITIASTEASPDIAVVARLGLEAETASPPVPLYIRGVDARPQFDKAIARR